MLRKAESPQCRDLDNPGPIARTSEEFDIDAWIDVHINQDLEERVAELNVYRFDIPFTRRFTPTLDTPPAGEADTFLRTKIPE
jgi:hypothetical protein